MIRIVVAEDQAMVLAALAMLLDMEPDIDVVGRAADGEAALAMVGALAPQVLVSDIEMPGLSGLDIASLIKESGSATAVVIVTTFGRSGYLRRALDAGVRGYLLKDSPPAELANAVRRVAAGGCAIAPALAEHAWDTDADLLTDRERAVLRLAADGQSNKEIARELKLSPGTVRNYMSETCSKLDAANRVEAGRIARDKGWL